MSGCAGCGGTWLDEVLDFGPCYLPDFVDPGEPRGARYPLRLVLCASCSLLQLGDVVPRDAVIHERYGFASGLNEANVADLRAVAEYALRCQPDALEWLDTGCNDGTLLSAVPKYIYRAGVDPVAKFAPLAARHADEIRTGYFDPGVYGPGRFDVVTSAAMFYALPDPGGFADGVRQVLATRGVWVIQQNYALDMLRNNVVDNIIHEHVTYFTVRSLQYLMRTRGLEVCDVQYSGVKGGCIRTLVCHRGARPVSESVGRAMAEEAAAGLDQPVTWRRWGLRARTQLAATRTLLEKLAARGDPAWCYGAGNRGGTLVQALGAGPELMPCAVERSAEKIGKVWTSAGIPIVSEEHMRAGHPGHLLMSPWFFRDGFIRREKDYLNAGGAMIFPLPRFEVVTA